MNYTLLRNSNFANDARLNHTPTVLFVVCLHLTVAASQLPRDALRLVQRGADPEIYVKSSRV